MHRIAAGRKETLLGPDALRSVQFQEQVKIRAEESFQCITVRPGFLWFPL